MNPATVSIYSEMRVGNEEPDVLVDSRTMLPTYYVAMNTSGNLEFWNPRSFDRLVEDVVQMQQHCKATTAPACMFVFKVLANELTFLHADRFLDAVRDGEITAANTAQGEQRILPPLLL